MIVWFQRQLALNLVKETFQEVPQPEYDAGGFGCEGKGLELSSVGELFCIICSY